MTIQDEGKQLRSEISKLRPDKRRRYGNELRERIMSWVDRACARGMSEAECAAMLGMKTWRFRTWRATTEKQRQRETLALVPVQISAWPTATGCAVVTATGYRVEGLGVDQVVALLRELS